MAAVDGFPRAGEDHLLRRYWHELGEPLLWLEVKLGLTGPGDWPNKMSHRRLDGLLLPDVHLQDPAARLRHWDDGHEDFADLVRGRRIQLIEVKKELNFDVIGQAIAGVDMFSRAYPDHGPIDQVAVVGGAPDAALDWLCAKRGIEVMRYT